MITDYLFLKVWLGVMLIAGVAGVVGSFSFLRRKSLVSDAVAHSVFPGICAGFMLSGTKDPILLLTGALISGLISVWTIDWINRSTKISEDTSIALVSTFFFALGSVLLSIISKSNNGNQTGLKDFMFGKVATLTDQDLKIFIVLSVLVLTITIFNFRRFQILTFNRDFAVSIGYKVNRIELILSSITVLVIAIGIQAVGIVLMSALVIAPAAIARYWTNKLTVMLILAGLFGAVSGGLGVFVSTFSENMPTGPWIVTVLFTLVIITLFFAPKKGWISIMKRQKSNRRKINEENVLKIFYQLDEVGKFEITYPDFLQKREMDTQLLADTLKKLIHKRKLKKNDSGAYYLTEKGKEEAARIVRSHRLWELYLTNRMNFKEDHIHGNAETIEHLITPELEKELLKELDFPKVDPHNKQIPY